MEGYKIVCRSGRLYRCEEDGHDWVPLTQYKDGTVVKRCHACGVRQVFQKAAIEVDRPIRNEPPKGF